MYSRTAQDLNCPDFSKEKVNQITLTKKENKIEGLVVICMISLQGLDVNWDKNESRKEPKVRKTLQIVLPVWQLASWFSVKI